MLVSTGLDPSQIRLSAAAPDTKSKKTLPKCSACRKGKKLCLPINRQWPEKCTLCRNKGLDCSEPQLALKRERRRSPSNEATPQPQTNRPRLAEKISPTTRPSLGPVAHCIQEIESTPKAEEAVLLLVISEMIDMALEELVTLADDMAKPFMDDQRFASPRDCIPDLKDTIDELQVFGHRLESRALDFKAGTVVSLVQSVLRSRYYSKRLMWTSNQSALDRVQGLIAAWDRPDYPGLAHVLQMKFLLEQPHLMTHNIESFLHFRENFLVSATDLIKRLDIVVPRTVQNSQMFLPSSFARFPAIVSQFSRWGLADCLGRSVAHILYDAGRVPATNINNPDILGRTVLYLACHNRNQEGVKLLLRAGAKLDVKAANGLRPLDVAAIAGDATSCREICNGAEKDSMNAHYHPHSDRSNRSPLMWAASFGNNAVVECLRNESDSVNATMDRFGYSAIGLAALRGHIKVIEYLIVQLCPCDTPDPNGRSPFWHAARGAYCDILGLLQSAGAFIDRMDNDGNTPLGIAAREGHADVVAFLLDERYDARVGTCLKRRANFLITNNSQHTPLFLAASAGRAKCVDLLLRLGEEALGDLNILHAYAAAQNNGFHDTCRVFLSYPIAILKRYHPIDPQSNELSHSMYRV